MKKTITIAVWTLILAINAHAAERTYSFGVTNQRTPLLTAEYWNPILLYVSRKSGVPLELKMGRGAVETAGMIQRGEFDFVYSNHIFIPQNLAAGYRVFVRPMKAAIRGQIVVLDNSRIRSLKGLAGKEVAFPSLLAFAGYAIVMDQLNRARIHIRPVFSSNQEGAIGQLSTRQVSAAGVNSEIMADFAKRENLKYRILWTSPPYLNLPIAAHPRVPQDKVDAVKRVFLEMAHDPAGLKILQSSAHLVKQKGPLGFVATSNQEYAVQKQIYKHQQKSELKS